MFLKNWMKNINNLHFSQFIYFFSLLFDEDLEDFNKIIKKISKNLNYVIRFIL